MSINFCRLRRVLKLPSFLARKILCRRFLTTLLTFCHLMQLQSSSCFLSPFIEECDRFGVKKDRSDILNKTYQMIILPKFYTSCFQNLLTPTQYKMLEILVLLLQSYPVCFIASLSPLQLLHMNIRITFYY
ncbi:hypothetical protein NIES4073_77540 [Kalymmatonema gypsitolerans NIES-4073]|nr:hypothetical protein NIES4073_77540 [Scytonema sp. NIES-4073]